MSSRILKTLSICVPVYYIYDAYNRSNQLSNFELAALKLGFNGDGDAISAEIQHEALLKQFQLAGYFKVDRIWQDLSRIGKIENPEKAFTEIYKVIKRSNADQDDPEKFNAKYMRKNLFKVADVQDSMDLIVYLSQHAFNRKVGQERYELSAQAEGWMTKHKKVYLDNARLLGLIDRKSPSKSEYDFAWIAGATRPGVLARLIDFHYNLTTYSLKVNGEILVLAGDRELWANIDGANPMIRANLLKALARNENIDSLAPVNNDPKVKLDEGKEYFLYLAKKFGIKLNSEKSLLDYKTKEECPRGRFINKIYANYDCSEKSKLTETLMVQDLLETDLANKLKACIIDTQSQGAARPTTATTARDAAKWCLSYINSNQEKFVNKKEFSVIFESNNPYIERQCLTAQTEVNKLLRETGLDKLGFTIKLEGVGYACRHEDVPLIHSEFGALLAEKWKLAMSRDENSATSKRDIKDLMYQSRNNSTNVPPRPETTQIFIVYDFAKYFFDKFN